MPSSIKPRLSPALGHGDLVPTLTVRHPHYSEYNIIVRLPALDENDTVDYDAALIICGIIADNSWKTGWFARASDGSRECKPDEPLAAGADVFYFVNDKTYKYPVHIGWHHWRLPSTDADLPSTFRSLSIDPPPLALCNGGYMEDLNARDQSCRVSGIMDFCEPAHLVPAGEREWWDANMGISSNLQIQSACNGLLLRADLHRAFDTGAWIPMAKKEGSLVVYVVGMTEVSNQFATLWHSREMQKLVGVNRRCIFARVARAVLSLHHEFLASRRLANVNLLVRLKDGRLKEMTPETFQHFSRSKSRNPSPTKRPRLQSLDEDELAMTSRWSAAQDDGLDSEDSQQDDDGAKFSPILRGRKRYRSPDLLDKIHITRRCSSVTRFSKHSKDEPQTPSIAA